MTTKHPVLVPGGTRTGGPGDGENGGDGNAGRAPAVQLDSEGVVVAWSVAAGRATGLTAAQTIGQSFAAICANRDFGKKLNAVRSGPVAIAVQFDGVDEETDSVQAVISPQRDTAGSLTGYGIDFVPPSVEAGTAGVAFADADAPANAFWETFGVARNSPAFLVDDGDLRILGSNPAASFAAGRPAGELTGLTLAEVLDVERTCVREERPDGAEVPFFFMRLANAEGDVRSYGVSAIPVRWESRDLTLCVLQDISGWTGMRAELTRTNLELSRLARHDHLTGLFNRPMFQDTLELANSRLDRLGGLLGVLYIDLDGYKLVNDRFGHDAGDVVLVEVARRLKNSVRSSDVIARLGGDEFGAILENLKKREDALKAAGHLIKGMEKPFEVEGERVHISASIGAVVTDHAVADVSALVVQADRMMYEAKSLGRGRTVLAAATGTPRRRRPVRHS